ncbi:hypothetical protein [Aquabacterium sp.]|uniref:hypothetical protein n=1 Tax=Aquabacterium sp. TaxID=1872578 RepID=UPI003D6CD080
MSDRTLVLQFASLIRQNGIVYTITRLGSTIGSCYMATTEIIETNSSDTNGSSTSDTESRELFVPANMTFRPHLGDDITSPDGSWHIVEVETYKPAKTVFAYRIKVV